MGCGAESVNDRSASDKRQGERMTHAADFLLAPRRLHIEDVREIERLARTLRRARVSPRICFKVIRARMDEMEPMVVRDPDLVITSPKSAIEEAGE